MEGLNGPFILEGLEYSGPQLTVFCRDAVQDPAKEEWLKEVYRFILDFMENPEKPLYHESSGTTGAPTRMALDRRAMIASAQKTLDFFSLTTGEPVMLCLPVKYIAGKMMIVRALAGGLDLYLKAPTSRPFRQEERKYSLVPVVPLQLHESLAAGDPVRQAGRILMGGAEPGPGLRNALARMTLPAVYESFGMSETYSHFALRRVTGPDPEPVFRVLEGTLIRSDERDCLEVSIPGITRGFVRTTDQVEICEGGTAFRWLGRLDNVINTGGIKVRPEALEQRIGALLGIPCLVVPEPDEKLGQRLVLLAETADTTDTGLWRDLLKQHLEDFEIPRRIVTVPELPRNRSFKPDREEAARLVQNNPWTYPNNSL